MQLINNIFIFFIKIYQFIFKYFPKVCRFNPSCSEYSIQAFKKYNFLKAIYLTIYRILRCNPFCKGGNDPLP